MMLGVGLGVSAITMVCRGSRPLLLGRRELVQSCRNATSSGRSVSGGVFSFTRFLTGDRWVDVASLLFVLEIIRPMCCDYFEHLAINSFLKLVSYNTYIEVSFKAAHYVNVQSICGFLTILVQRLCSEIIFVFLLKTFFCLSLMCFFFLCILITRVILFVWLLLYITVDDISAIT